MRIRHLILIILAASSFAACTASKSIKSTGDISLSFPNENRITNLRQLTYGGTNAEAYWSFDGKWLTFQHTGADAPCDQIFKIGVDGSDRTLISNNEGRTTCSYFYPDDSKILFSSTKGSSLQCPAEPDKSKGYVWPIYPSYQFYQANLDGKDVLPIEPGAPTAYNAEMTVCKDGQVVFTSDRNGDLDLYTGRIDVSTGMLTDIKQVTNTLGYDGGAFFSQDCKQLVWRASRPKPGKELNEYLDLLGKHLVKPGKLEIWIAKADGTDARQVTRVGAASFAPYFTPEGDRILFASNIKDPTGRRFDIYMIKTNGTELEQITYSNTFDSFPMFSPDGKYLAFSSNRNARKPRETNVFVADWNGRIPGPILTDEDPDPANRFYSIVKELSSPDLEGRGVGTEGLKLAEDYVKDLYKRLELKSLNEAFKKQTNVQNYEHPFEIVKGTDLDEKNTTLKADWRHLKTREEFAPASFSALGEFKGNLVEVGYGIVAPELNIDDYSGKTTQNKIVLIRRKVPAGLNLTPEQEANYSDLKYKTFIAREKGAKAVIFWNPDSTEIEKEDLLESIRKSDDAISGDSGIPVVFVSKRIAREWLAAPKAVQIFGNISILKRKETAHNIVGVLDNGGACTKQKPILVGAHLDHLGYGGHGSLDSSFLDKIHPGADDNASGVAALIETAQFLKKQKAPGCFVFAAFSAEEMGIIGSSRFAEFLKEQSIKPKAMINMDMVGRMKNNSLIIFGTKTATQWEGILKKQCGEFALTCHMGGDGYGPSDHMPFYISKIPVLHLFTGTHADYHRTTDTVDKINATGGVQVAELVAAVAKQAAQSNQGLSYVKVKSTNTMGMIRNRGDQMGHGAYLGTIPDYAQMTTVPGAPASTTPVKGVRLSGVRDGSPAALAELTEGDVITSVKVLDEEPGYTAVQPKTYQIHNLQDYAFVISNLKPGLRIKISILRKDRTLDVDATVGKKSKTKE